MTNDKLPTSQNQAPTVPPLLPPQTKIQHFMSDLKKWLAPFNVTSKMCLVTERKKT